MGDWMTSSCLRFSCRLLAVSLLIAATLFLLPGSSQAEFRQRYNRDFRLTGQLTLTYDRYWGSRKESVDAFTYGLNLGLSGFVVDPRLMTFHLQGIFSQSFVSDRDTNTIEGISARLRFLNERPVRGLLRYVPQPIELRYGYSIDDIHKTQYYGLSMEYQLDKVISRRVLPSTNINNNTGNSSDTSNKNSNQNSNDNSNQERGQKKSYSLLPFTLPHLLFDYNRYETSTDETSRTHDRLSLRAISRSKHGLYTAEYRYDRDDYSVSTSVTHYLKLQAELHYYWKETSSQLDNLNTFYAEDSEGRKTVSFTNHTVWMRHFGSNLRDTLTVGGGVTYLSREDKSNYSLTLNTGYNKHFSERFINYASADVSYVHSDTETVNTETITNSLQYSLSRNITLINRVRVSNSSRGASYGLNAGLHILSFIALSPAYDFYFTEFEGAQKTTHTFSLNLSGPIWRQMAFFSRNSYMISEDSNSIDPVREKRLSLAADLFWRFSRYNISLSAAYLDSTLSGLNPGLISRQDMKTTMTTFGANLSTQFSRNLTLMVYAYYQKMNRNPYSFVVSPVLNWQWRRVTLTARYTLNMYGNSQVDHRVFLRVSRQIDSPLKPFF